MKKNFKALSSFVCALALVFSLSVSAFAADISADKAKSVALKDAGYKSSQVSYLYAEPEYDDGVKYYDVSFSVKKSDGKVYEYDYEVRASDGKILEKDYDVEYVKSSSGAASSSAKSSSAAKASSSAKSSSAKADIGVQAAKQAAAKHFGFKADEVKYLEVNKDYDDGVAVYDVEFCEGFNEKFSCEVVASSGAVRDAEREAVRGLEDKFELFLKAFFYSIFNQ